MCQVPSDPGAGAGAVRRAAEHAGRAQPQRRAARGAPAARAPRVRGHGA